MSPFKNYNVRGKEKVAKIGVLSVFLRMTYTSSAMNKVKGLYTERSQGWSEFIL